MNRRRIIGILIGTALIAGLFTLSPAQPAQALDVYTTPGTHHVNGRVWRTTCEKYSSTVERCRTEIQATTITYSRGRYVEKFGWTFNNLTYKPSRRAQWAGNVLATPGEHVSGGRRWKTECDSAWTGRNACRSSILTTTYRRSGNGYAQGSTWVFNNIVHFSDSSPTTFCVPGGSASAGVAAMPANDDIVVPGEDPTPPPRHSPEATAAPDDLTPTPSLSPSPSPSPSQSPSPSPSQGSPPETPTPSPKPDPTVTESPTPSPSLTAPVTQSEPRPLSVEPAAATVTLGRIQHPDHPVGVLYDRLGAFRVEGSAAGATQVKVELIDATGKVRSSATVVVASSGAFAASLKGGFAGKATVKATAANATATRAVELRKAGITQSTPTRIDPLATSKVTGTLTPGIGNVLVTAYVSTSSGWVAAGSARTASDGDYSIPFAYGKGTLGTWQVRSCATLTWGPTIPAAASSGVTRARIANPVITNTTAAEVASTYRSGCPVGPSGLSTIRINQQSMDGRVYRGEIIVRRDRASDVAQVFAKTFEGGFPVFQMTNPNAFGGDDIKSMAANNTSAFNCRKVVGNPYALSPHSYGYAVDVNPWQNPYRDPQGRWHPSTQHVSRTPVVPGMLTTGSVPVREFRARGWEWFSGWDWHHFEKK